MNTSKKLTAAYDKALTKSFDQHSKFVFFSDLHRGDGSISDEFTHNQTLMLCALKYYYTHGYTYIEVGDGDELWEHPKFSYIRSAHTDIFTALKAFYDQKRFIMLYGNHNIFLKHKHYVAKNYFYFYDEYHEKVEPLFYGLRPIGSLLLVHKQTGQEILVLHGHQGDLMNDQLWFINMILLRYFWRFIHVVGIKNPSSPARNEHKRHKIEINYSKWLQNKDLLLICGHTHRLKFPKKGDVPYFNSGCCIHTKGIVGIEILNDQIMIVQWRIDTDATNNLKVIRKIIRGPKPLSSFHK